MGNDGNVSRISLYGTSSEIKESDKETKGHYGLESGEGFVKVSRRERNVKDGFG